VTWKPLLALAKHLLSLGVTPSFRAGGRRSATVIFAAFAPLPPTESLILSIRLLN
jgi:hypothetical protein